MTSLSILQQILPVEEKDNNPGTNPIELKTLSQYAKLVKNPPHSLEQLRSSLDPINRALDATPEELYLLIDQFEQHKQDIESQKQKLLPIQTILSQFNSDLKQLLSSLILSREKSTQLSQDLYSQNDLTERLNPIILDLMVPPDIVKSIMKAPIDPEWLENLRFLTEKSQLVKSDTNPYKGSKALEELEEAIVVLTAKCVERIRDHIIGQVKLLRLLSTHTSSQQIQKDLLLVKEIYPFLFQHHEELAKQLRLAYTYTMKWYYETKFAKYIYALQKLRLRHVNNTLVLGSLSTKEDKSGVFGFGLKGWFNGSTGAAPSSASSTSQLMNTPDSTMLPQSPQTHKILMSEYLPSIEKRMTILQPAEEGEPDQAIPSQIAETTPFAYWLEFLYKQWSVALIDNVIVEYLFMVDFFYFGDEKFDEMESKKNWLDIMFSNVFKIGHGFVNWLITHQPLMFLPGRGTTNNRVVSLTLAASQAVVGGVSGGSLNGGVGGANVGSCDAYAILLIIRMVQNHQSALHNEFHVPIADEYLNSLLLLLWPHFTKIIDLNCESMKRSVLHSKVGGSVVGVNLAPVGVTQQFAQFLVGLLKLAHAGGTDDTTFQGEPLFISIRRLRNDFESVLTKVSNSMFAKKNGKEKELFLFNNYFLVVNILKNETMGDKLFEEEITHFEMLCQAYKS